MEWNFCILPRIFFYFKSNLTYFQLRTSKITGFFLQRMVFSLFLHIILHENNEFDDWIVWTEYEHLWCCSWNLLELFQLLEFIITTLVFHSSSFKHWYFSSFLFLLVDIPVTCYCCHSANFWFLFTIMIWFVWLAGIYLSIWMEKPQDLCFIILHDILELSHLRYRLDIDTVPSWNRLGQIINIYIPATKKLQMNKANIVYF